MGVHNRTVYLYYGVITNLQIWQENMWYVATNNSTFCGASGSSSTNLIKYHLTSITTMRSQ